MVSITLIKHYMSLVGIEKVDPMIRLEVLKKYIGYRIDRFPTCTLTFEKYFHQKFRHLIPGTVDHAKAVATHCFYCNRLYTSEKSFQASVDHYLPQSVGQTKRYVICCVDCNNRKGNTIPEALVTQLVNAHLRGKVMWGYHGKKLKFIYKQIQTITNDMLYGMGPRIYYIKR
jgi:5-methylcytosine-specific restriction endonuclease McrA